MPDLLNDSVESVLGSVLKNRFVNLSESVRSSI